MGHRAQECPFENNQMSNQWFKGMGQTKATTQPPRMQQQTQGSNHPDLGALPMDQLRKRIQNSSPCAPVSDHAWGQARPSVSQEKQRCSNCQETGCNIQSCPIMQLTASTTPQEEECRAKENLASILHNIKAMSIEDWQGMIEVLFEKESTIPAKIRACQVGSIKPMTKEQVWKRLWQFSAEERKEIGLIFRPRKTHKEPQKEGTPVQIHTLQIKQQGGSPRAQIQTVKTKQLTKTQVKKNLQ